MFCKKCGKDIDINSKVCPNCGEETNFLKGIDGSEMPDHLKTFEKEINAAFNGSPVEKVHEDEFEDISSYTSSNTGFIPKVSTKEPPVEDKNITSSFEKPKKKSKPKKKKKEDYNDTYVDDKQSNTWKFVAGGCVVVIVICLIIIFVASCNSNSKPSGGTTTSTVPSTVATTTAPKNTTTVPATTVPTTAQSVDSYIQSSTANDTTAVQTAQSFYADIEDACAKGDLAKFKTYFSSAYTDAEIEEIYNQYKDTCAGYESFIVGYTQTVSCDQYIYVYIASTTNTTTNDYVENTFVLSKEDGTFKVDGKTDGAKAYLQQAPTKMAQ